MNGNTPVVLSINIHGLVYKENIFIVDNILSLIFGRDENN